MTLHRTDIHRPAVIEPLDYEFVGFEYLKDVDPLVTLGEREAIRAHMLRTGGHYATHAHGGNCHICGAAAVYTALHYHEKTGVYVRTGLDCAEKLGCGDAEMFRAKIGRALEAAAGKRKALAILEREGIAKAYELYTARYARDHTVVHRDDTRDEMIIFDMVGKLIKYGDMTPKALAFLKVLVDRVDRAVEIAEERAAARAAEKAAAKPVPVDVGRITVRATILGFKVNDFGRRMLIKTEGGYKLFGAVPAAIADHVEKGDEIEFDAVVVAARDDPFFGFFKRPTKARITTAPKEEDVDHDYYDDGRDLNRAHNANRVDGFDRDDRPFDY